ncbi:putative nucleoside-diphosphate-sugar epimerase [Trichodelitschia bisporula]|uniref:Putative nucleoside-diphosphate-sugar epimerase n=1 Tax=Trichodelitschia bisporula TaxID=703511 RepID=A0A6G1I800_9PEZI|nr:putative nucleoside-diphosphate-sugar epimerase [Trichodelitschia bisporula]
MPKLFVTGATGYIGGDALFAILEAHPKYEITCLVRNSTKGAAVAKQHPTVRLVYGDLDSTNLLATEAAAAEIVCHFAHADHEPSVEALVRGLASTHSTSKPGYLIHTSGTGSLSVYDAQAELYGSYAEKTFSDTSDIAELTSLPDTASHRNVEKAILASPPSVHTAIVSPPTIYGTGRGAGNRASDQVNKLAAHTLTRGRGFTVGDGENRWCEVHIADLSRLYVALVEAAAARGGHATWNAEGYYFAEAGEFAWEEVANAIARAAFDFGLIKTDDVQALTKEEVDEIEAAETPLWGRNSRCRAERARELLGWRPVEKGLMELVPEIVRGEAVRLGLLPEGHKAVAAGEA